MDAVIGSLVGFFVGDYYAWMSILGIVIGLIIAGAQHRWRGGTGWRTILDHYVLWGIGIASIANFIFHSFLGDFSAAQIGWDQSPFQMELALASLGFGVVGVIAFPRRAGWVAKLVACTGPGIFMFGAGFVHIVDMIQTGNLAFGNAGPILYTDLLYPIVSAVILGFALREQRRAANREGLSTDRHLA